MSEENQGGLSASEAAYFESGGETEIIAEPAATPEPAPVVEQDPEQIAAEAVVEPGAEPDKNKFVPHGALHAEREERKKLQVKLEELTTKSAILEDRWNTILTARQTPQEEVKAPPNPEEDIFAFAKWQGEQLKELQDKIAGREQQETQSRQQSEQEQAVWNEWNSSVQTFAAEKPDFKDAAQFLSDTREKQLVALGRVDPRFRDQQARTAQINAELKGIVFAAKQQGVSPAEMVYQISQDYGFAPKAPDPVVTSEKIEQIDAAQNASRTLAASPGKQAGDALNAQSIADMSREEFDRWYSKPENQRRFDKMMGG
jgi:hypothetical protein